MDTKVESLKEDIKDKQDEVKFWHSQIRHAIKERDEWRERSKEILRRFQDKREGVREEKESRFNFLWANHQTLQPVIYAQPAKPLADKRFRKQDPVTTMAAEILEGGMAHCAEEYDFHREMKACRDDYLLISQGIARVRFVPTFGVDEATGVEGLIDASVVAEHYNFKDFITSPGARVWREVTFEGFRSYLTVDDFLERFDPTGERNLKNKIKPDFTPDGLDEKEQENQSFKKHEVWEIWDKSKRRVLFVAMNYADDFLEVAPDPLGLKDFFPNPPPVLCNLTNESLIPVPDYSLIQDLAGELDEVTQRIRNLTKAIRVVAVYNAEHPELARVVESENEFDAIPVESYASFQAKGGLAGSIEFLPVTQMIEALQVLYQRQADLKQQLQEMSGRSDIVRGQSDPRETATAQTLKSQYASVRTEDRQRDFSEFVRGFFAIKAEIMAEKFPPATLAMMSDQEMENPLFMPAVEMLRSEKLRRFKIAIETDSTIALDEQAEKESRIEFLQAMGGFFNNSLPLITQFPQMSQAFGEMLKFGSRAFRAGRQLETAIDDSVDTFIQAQVEMLEAPPEEAAPDPAMMKAQADSERAQMDAQMKGQELQQKAMREQAELQLKAQEAAQKAQLAQAELQLKAEDLALRREEIGLRARESDGKIQAEFKRLEQDMFARMADLAQRKEESIRKEQMEGAKLMGHAYEAKAKLDQDGQHIESEAPKPKKARKRVTFGYDASGNRTADIEEIEDIH